ncbi:MAG: RsmE family RNA methyltransferase [Flavitalea sp.]
MQLFYVEPSVISGELVELPEESSRHISSVLRMQVGEEITLTNGKGTVYNAVIDDAHKKRTRVRITGSTQHEKPRQRLMMGVSLLKNTSRFEWFLEKATEIGVTDIVPLICSRTEKQQFRKDRMQTILVSAMMQSNQFWLPELYEPVKFKDSLSLLSEVDFKMIAHCEAGDKQELQEILTEKNSRSILIGPEGDFTPEEIELALGKGFRPVSLGDTRLRTETACIVAATLLKNLGHR